VQVEGRTVNLSVTPHGLRVGPEALWYSARVDAGVAPVRASSAQ
jgi:hypothetical protein